MQEMNQVCVTGHDPYVCAVVMRQTLCPSQTRYVKVRSALLFPECQDCGVENKLGHRSLTGHLFAVWYLTQSGYVSGESMWKWVRKAELLLRNWYLHQTE
jgi:hypothetical protein